MLYTHFMLLAILFALLDAIWLKSTQALYKKTLRPILRTSPRWTPAILFYATYVVGLLVFAFQPGVDAKNTLVGLWHGALFGGIAYATYDLTNYAVLEHWNARITILDICWGAIASGTCVWLALLILGY